MKVGPRIYKHIDGQFEARYRKGRRPDGSILYGSVYGKTFDEAEKKRAEILHSLAKEAENDPEAAAVSNDNKSLRIYCQTYVKASSRVDFCCCRIQRSCRLPCDEIQDYAHHGAAAVAMKDTIANEITVVESDEIVRM